MFIKKYLVKLIVGFLFNTFVFAAAHAQAQARDAINIFKSIFNAPTSVSPSYLKNNAAANIPGNTSVQRSIVYAGYSQEFLAIKNLLTAEQWLQAYQLQNNKVKQLDPADFLGSNEAGLIALDTGDSPSSIKHFAAAEHFLKMSAEKSFVEDSVLTYGSELMGMISGVGDLTEYNGAPFERILMLNYKSIAYLLNGERKAYNVTRRAIDWQNIEQKEFEKSVESAKKKIAEEQQKINEQQPEISATSSSANIFKVISDQYKSSEKTALSVSSAYVNPFGFYMAGIVQEFDSLEDSYLRDNARISYKKALKLNPNSKVIKTAVRDIKKSPRRGRRLVHVVIADGFAPEKKTLQFGLPMPGGVVPVKLPIYEPVVSKVAYIRIKSGKTTLATLSTVANIEAIVLRHQLDSLPFQHFKVLASVARSTAENVIWGQFGAFGQMGKNFRESMANPDMRAWMSLPKRLLAARFYASKRLKNVTIVTYDKRWRRLSTRKVALPKNEHSFIYARTIDKIINANVNKTLWVKAK